MKKRALTLLLVLALLLALAVPAMAATPRTGKIDLTADTIPDAVTQAAEGWSWNDSTKTLTLDGVDLKTENASCIWLPDGDCTIVLKGENKLAFTAKGDEPLSVTGILSNAGSVTVTGDGSLSITGAVDAPESYAYGIFCVGALNLRADLSVSIAAAHGYAYALCAAYVSATDCDVSVSGSAEMDFIALFSGGDLLLDGAAVKVEATTFGETLESAEGENYEIVTSVSAICANGDLSIQGSAVRANISSDNTYAFAVSGNNIAIEKSVVAVEARAAEGCAGVGLQSVELTSVKASAVEAFGSGIAAISYGGPFKLEGVTVNVGVLTEENEGGQTFVPTADSALSEDENGLLIGAAKTVKIGVTGAVFTDVPANHWAYDYIYDILGRKITTGTSDTTFEPDAALNRAQFVTFLGRLAGVDPTEYKTGPFTDIGSADYSWAVGYINWAYKSGITTGATETTFEPGKDVTREQAATFVKRYTDGAGIDLNPEKLLNAMNIVDFFAVSDWAAEAVTAVVYPGYMSLSEGNYFRPADACTRAEMAQLLSLLPTK